MNTASILFSILLLTCLSRAARVSEAARGMSARRRLSAGWRRSGWVIEDGRR
jgi:hypothetical protein